MTVHPARWPTLIVVTLGLICCWSALTPQPAYATRRSGCHKFSVWNYPYPQTCEAHHRLFRADVPIQVTFPLPPSRELDMPDLTADWGNEPDPETRGRLMLHALLR
jgi:hypothetical protein